MCIRDRIETAYELAAENYSEDKNNRVILASDGDFNVGLSSVDALNEFISEKRDRGIYLSILGFGTGNLRDDVMETLAANGDGNYSYVDTLTTAQKVLVDEMGANLYTVANDVKAQIQFNKENVKEFRLLGYENRLISSCLLYTSIRPVIDGRWGGIREGLENQTMGMAKAAKELIERNVFYSDGTPAEVIICLLYTSQSPKTNYSS